MAGTICLRRILILLTSIGLLVIAGHAEDIRIGGNEPVKSGSEFGNFNSDCDSVEIGDTIHLVGKIDRSLILGSPSDTVILISAPDGSYTDTFVLSSPDLNGAFEYYLPADVLGTWGFEALYGGINSPKVEVETVPSTESGKTTLTLSGWPVYPRIGEEVLFKGRLTDSSGKGISARNISFESASFPQGCDEICISSDPSVWVLSGSVKTNQAGEYGFSLPVIEEGGIHIRVIFHGDDQYSLSESRVIRVSVSDL
ncbi:MAG: hypothetical protein CVV33_03370 [Methanomicrobiales archaeon HGW-Methanomicrobiales-4]|nr:MAG: hypothetical protein CVV33_03370 [Methanomicrobiales archaeon HGW-Methanomicrobiales-4]